MNEGSASFNRRSVHGVIIKAKHCRFCRTDGLRYALPAARRNAGTEQERAIRASRRREAAKHDFVGPSCIISTFSYLISAGGGRGLAGDRRVLCPQGLAQPQLNSRPSPCSHQQCHKSRGPRGRQRWPAAGHAVARPGRPRRNQGATKPRLTRVASGGCGSTRARCPSPRRPAADPGLAPHRPRV